VIGEHVIGERVTPEGEQYVVAPLGIVHGGEVQCNQDERTDVLHVGSLNVDVGDDDDLVVVVRPSSTTGGAGGGVGRGDVPTNIGWFILITLIHIYRSALK
jgi:hypothetical protein